MMVRSRRLADLADRGLGGLNWAENARRPNGGNMSTFAMASAHLAAIRRRASESQADGSGLPGARNGLRLGLN